MKLHIVRNIFRLYNIEVSMLDDYVVKTLEHQNNNAPSKKCLSYYLWDRNCAVMQCAVVQRSFDLYSSQNFPSDQKLLQNAEVTKNGKALVFPHGNSLAFGFCHGLRTSRKFLIENPKLLDLGRQIGSSIFGAFGVFSAPILILWVHVFPFINHYFYKKLNLWIQIPNIYLGLGF